MIILVVILYVLMFFYEFIPLYRKKQKNDILVNGVLFIGSFTIAILLCIGIAIPSPVKPIEKLIISVFGK